MSGRTIALVAMGLLASCTVMLLGRNRLPEPVTQGLAFWVLFLLMPTDWSGKAGGGSAFSVRHVLAATAAAAMGFVLSFLIRAW